MFNYRLIHFVIGVCFVEETHHPSETEKVSLSPSQGV